MSGSAGAAKRPIVLHFDLNKTIIMCDPVKGVNVDDQLNVLLSEACWGTWDEGLAIDDDAEKQAAAATWRLVKGPTTEMQLGLVTYGVLLEEILRMEKPSVQALKNSFTEPGNAGEAIRNVYEELQGRLRLPDGVAAVPGVPPEVGAGRCFIIPAFFHTVLKLHREGRDFRIVFRTFGSDTATVLNEFNLFCQGQHPCFPSVPENLQNWAIELPGSSGEWYRDDNGLHLALCMPCQDQLLVQQAHGAEACAAALRRRLFGPDMPIRSMALRDFFPFWRKRGEACDAGKPLLIEPMEDACQMTAHHIFFDDNIERDRAHIVDARDARTGDALVFARTQGVYLIRAEPLAAIRDPDYFLKAIADAEAKLAAEGS